MQFPSPSLVNPVAHLRDTVSTRQPPLPSEWYPKAQITTDVGTDGGRQFPYPSEVYPLLHVGEETGGLTHCKFVSRTNPSEHDGILIVNGTFLSVWQTPLVFKNYPDGQAEVVPSV